MFFREEKYDDDFKFSIPKKKKKFDNNSFN